MACMTHDCTVCGETVFDNSPYTKCPVCGGQMIHSFDEDESDYDELRGIEREEPDVEQED